MRDCFASLAKTSREIASLRSQRQAERLLPAYPAYRQAGGRQASLLLLISSVKNRRFFQRQKAERLLRPLSLREATERSDEAISYYFPAKSLHSGFMLLIKSIFFFLEPALICFSLIIAFVILLYSS